MGPKDASTSLMLRGDTKLRSLFSIRRGLLRLRSFYSGVPYTALKLFYVIGVRLDSAIVVDRSSGEIAGEWSGPLKRDEQKAEARRQALHAAIAAYAADARAAFGEGRRVLDLGASRVHIFATPGYILAVEHSGPGSRKLTGVIDIALRKSLESAPGFISLITGKATELQGLASKAGPALEKSLARANLPPYGEAQRPIFAHTAVAIITIAGITATSEAILKKYVSGPNSEAGLAAPSKLSDHKTGASQTVSVSTLGSASEIGRPAKRVRPARHTTPDAPQPVNLPVSEALPPSPAKPALEKAEERVTIAKGIVDSALSNLPNFDQGAGLDLKSWNQIDINVQSDTNNISSAVSVPAGLLQGQPVTVSDQGVMVGLFSTGGGGNSLLSPIDATGSSGGNAQGALATTTSGVASLSAGAQSLASTNAVTGMAGTTVNSALGTVGKALH